jgi:hypothetical protein
VPIDTTKSRPTPYDRNYPTCLETYATLRVYSHSMSPETISAKLDLEPSETMTNTTLPRS